MPKSPHLWKKGQSGNPSGLSKALVEVSKAAKEYTHEAIAYLGEVLRNSEEAPTARLKAAEVLLDRGWGRPSQTVNVRKIKSLEDLDEDELQALAGLAEKATHDPLH